MSESLNKKSVAGEIIELLRLCRELDVTGSHLISVADFKHRVAVTQILIPAGSTYDVDVLIPASGTAIVTAIDIVAINNPADATLGTNDWRATDDINPYYDFVADSVLGTIEIIEGNVTLFPVSIDIGVINQGVLFVCLNSPFRVRVSPNMPAAERIIHKTRVNYYIVPSHIGFLLKPLETLVTSNNI